MCWLMLIVVNKNVIITYYVAKTLFLVCPGPPGDPGTEDGTSYNYPGPVGAPGDSGVRGHPGNANRLTLTLTLTKFKLAKV